MFPTSLRDLDNRRLSVSLAQGSQGLGLGPSVYSDPETYIRIDCFICLIRTTPGRSVWGRRPQRSANSRKLYKQVLEILKLDAEMDHTHFIQIHIDKHHRTVQYDALSPHFAKIKARDPTYQCHIRMT